MSPLVIFGIIVALLFGGAFLTKRRFGILGLALAAGAVLAQHLGLAGGLLFASLDIHVSTLSPENLALVMLILSPAFFLMLHGPRHHSSLQRLGAPLLFTLLALALALQPLRPLLTSSGTGISIFRLLAQYRELIIAGGLVAAIVDAFFLKGSTHSKHDPKH